MTHIRQNHLWLLAITLLLSVFGARAQSSGSEGATWTVNPHDYKYDMTLYTSIVTERWLNLARATSSRVLSISQE